MKTLEKTIANWLINDFKGMLAKRKMEVETCGISPEDFGFLVWTVYCGWHSREECRDLLTKRLDNLDKSETKGI